MAKSDWRKRFTAASITLPSWAIDRPERAVYLSNASGKYEGYAWDRDAGTHRMITDRPEGTSSVAIDPTGEWIWWFDDSKGNEKGGWRVEGFAGGEARLAAADVLPAYQAGLALGTGLAVIGTADAGTHRVDVVVDGEPARRIYEHLEAANVGGLSRDNTLVAIAHSEHGDSRNRALRILALDGTAVVELWDGPGQGLLPGGWSPVRGDQRMLVSHERTGSQRPAIWRPLDDADDAVEEIDLDLPGEVGASWYPDASALLISHLWRGRTELHRLDLSTGIVTRIETARGVISGARVRPDGELWYGITTSATASEVHCGAEILLPPGDPAPSGVRYTDLEAGDVHAFLAEPPGPRPHPTFFRIHGGPAGLDADMFSASVQALVDHGFAVVLVNYRGSMGYGKAWRDAIVGRPGVMELEDIAAVRNLVVEGGIADPERIVLSGGSWGGYLTLLGMGTQPELWSLGISAVPLADLAAHYHQQSEPLQAYWRSLFGGTPDEIAEVLKDISPIEHVARLAAPLLILAGDNDPRCPLGQVLNYVGELERLGKTHEVYRFDAGHASLVIEEQIHQMELQLDMAARHLGTPPPASEQNDDRVSRRAANLLPEEHVVGSANPRRQAKVILEDSDARSHDREAAPSSFVEHRTSDEATEPTD